MKTNWAVKPHSTNWAVKPNFESVVNLLSSFLPVQWNDVNYLWNSYCAAVVDESEEWSSCVASQLSWSSIASVSQRSRVRIPSKPWCFRFLPSNCLSWKIYCDDHSSLSSSTAAQYEFHINFTSSHCTGRHEFNKLTSLPTCGFTAQLIEHRTDIAEVTGSNPVETLLFFRLLPISQIRKFTAMIILHFHLQHCLTKASNTSPVKDQKTKST